MTDGKGLVPVVSSSRSLRHRPTIVGRSAARRVVSGWLDLAAEGEPRVGFLRGEHGSGRSVLLRAILDDAEQRGRFTVLQVSASTRSGPPLVPIVTMLEPLLDQVRAGRRTDLSVDDRNALTVLLNDDTAVPRTGVRRRGSDDAQRFLATSRLLLGVVRSRPVLLAIDDAHLLDDASAELLAHLVASAAHAAETVPVHLATILTVRTATSRLRAGTALGRIADEEGAAMLEVDGLDELGLNELLTLHGPAPPARPLLASILRRTSGNPRLALALWHLVLDDDATAVRGGSVFAAHGVAEHGRLSLDDVVERRASALSDECRSLLTIAAVIGHEGRIDALTVLAGRPVDEVERLLAEAETSGACRFDERSYRFEDPLLPATLARSVLPSRRRRLHGEIAAALASVPEPSPQVVAGHLRLTDQPDPDACHRWGLLAAARSMALGSWGEAAAGFALTLDHDRVEVDDPQLRLGILLQATTAFALDHDLEGCERYGREAIALARVLGDLDAWCAALAEITHSTIRVAEGGALLPTDDLEAFVDAVGDEVPHLRARVLALRAEIHFIAFDYDRGQAFADAACALAQVAGDHDLIAFVRFAEGLQCQGRLDLDASDHAFAASIVHADASAHSPVGARSRARLPSARWIRGLLREADDAADEAEELADEVQDWAELSLVSAWRANIAGASGHFAEAELMAERALVRHRRSDYAFTPIVACPVLAIARAMRGDVGGAHLALALWRSTGGSRFSDRLDILIDCLAADPPQAREVLAERPWRAVGHGSLDLRRAGTLLAQAEVGAAAGDATLLTGAGGLVQLHERGVRFIPGSLSLVSRMCAAVVAVDDLALGLRWIELARREADAFGAAAERVRCDLDEALLLRSRGHHDDDRRAERLLLEASQGFDRLEMMPFRRQADRHLGNRGSGESGTRKIILFTDLVESTSLNVSAGDDAYVELLRAHDRIVRDCVRRHAGVEFKHTGDGIAVWFASGVDAVACALSLQERLTGLLLADAGVAVQVRCGLAAGAPIVEGTDLFGLAVTSAARICAAAPPGVVLVSGAVAELAADAAVRFVPHGSVDLKGIPGSTPLLRAEPDFDASRQLPAQPPHLR